MNIFLGILFVLFGIGFMYFSKNFDKRFGKWSWAEQYLGGTTQGYIIMGFVFVVLGVMALFGVVNLAK